MESKKYYGTGSRTYNSDLAALIFAAVVFVLGLVFIISISSSYDFLFRVSYWLRDFDMDIWELENFVKGISLFLIFLGIVTAFSSIRELKNLSRPVVELGGDSVKVVNIRNGCVTDVKYDNIDRIEMSESKCINIIPTKKAYNDILSSSKEQSKMKMRYEKTGAVVQILGKQLNQSVESVYEDFQKSLNDYKKNNK